jgi:hypothetical protein
MKVTMICLVDRYLRLYIDGKSVEDKLKQCVSGTMIEGNMQYRKGTKVCSEEHQ